jgi:hypothetical protein
VRTLCSALPFKSPLFALYLRAVTGNSTLFENPQRQKGEECQIMDFHIDASILQSEAICDRGRGMEVAPTTQADSFLIVDASPPPPPPLLSVAVHSQTQRR